MKRHLGDWWGLYLLIIAFTIIITVVTVAVATGNPTLEERIATCNFVNEEDRVWCLTYHLEN